jgi:hypothetical protein
MISLIQSLVAIVLYAIGFLLPGQIQPTSSVTHPLGGFLFFTLRSLCQSPLLWAGIKHTTTLGEYAAITAIAI